MGDSTSHPIFVHVIDIHYVWAACDASYLAYYIVWRVNLSKLSRKFVWALRTTTNCRVSFIDLYLAFRTNFRIVLLPHTNIACVAAGPRTRLNHLYSPLYTEGLKRLRRRLIQTLTVILLEPYCGAITEPGLPVGFLLDRRLCQLNPRRQWWRRTKSRQQLMHCSSFNFFSFVISFIHKLYLKRNQISLTITIEDFPKQMLWNYFTLFYYLVFLFSFKFDFFIISPATCSLPPPDITLNINNIFKRTVRQYVMTYTRSRLTLM